MSYRSTSLFINKIKSIAGTEVRSRIQFNFILIKVFYIENCLLNDCCNSILYFIRKLFIFLYLKSVFL